MIQSQSILVYFAVFYGHYSNSLYPVAVIVANFIYLGCESIKCRHFSKRITIEIFCPCKPSFFCCSVFKVFLVLGYYIYYLVIFFMSESVITVFYQLVMNCFSLTSLKYVPLMILLTGDHIFLCT